MKKLLILLTFIGFCIGCAGGNPYGGWHRHDTSEKEMRRDMRKCEMYGKAHSNLNPFLALELMGDCMLVKGYNKQ